MKNGYKLINCTPYAGEVFRKVFKTPDGTVSVRSCDGETFLFYRQRDGTRPSGPFIYKCRVELKNVPTRNMELKELYNIMCSKERKDETA